MKIRLVAAVGAVLLLLVPLSAYAAKAIELPADLKELLPAEPAALVCFSSVDALQDQWAGFADALVDEDDEEETPDLVAWLSEQLPRFDEAVDTGRPIAMAVDFTPIMMGQEPFLTWIVPLKTSFTDRENFDLDAATSSTVIRGDYLAIHSAPGYVPGDGDPALASNMVPGVVTAALDLEGVLKTYRPFVEMGLASIPVGVVSVDTLDTGEVVEQEGMTQEEADALTAMIRQLMDSVRRMDMGVGADGGLVEYDMRLAMLPDTPLAPGPMPDFKQAVELTRLLPGGGDFRMAIAMDMKPQFDIFADYYVMNAKRESEKLGPELGPKYAAWFEKYIESVDMWSKPLAADYGFDEDGMIVHAALATEDAAGDLARMVEVVEGLSDIGVGISLTRQNTIQIDGVDIRAWDVTINSDALIGFTGKPTNPQLSGMGRMQAEQMSAILYKIVPGLSMCAKGDYLLISADPDPMALAGMIKAADGKGGKVDQEIKKIAEAAGPGTCEVVTGDLMAILNWVTEFMDEVPDEDWDVIKDNPIPFNGVYTIEDATYGFAMSMDMPALKNLIRAFDEMDLDEEFEDDENENEEESDETVDKSAEDG